MPRKPKQDKKRITVSIRGTPISVTLFPPTGSRKSWYAYWSGLVTSKTTGATSFDDAVKAVEFMLQNGGRKGDAAAIVLSDVEFEQLQKEHYGRRTGKRPTKSLKACLEAISAFRQLSGLNPVTAATAEDCAAFQKRALETPKNWRAKYPKGKTEDVDCISRNTVLKWSRELQAAFERANINAGKKCVRGVGLAPEKLLTANPWKQFTWIEGEAKPIRQFDGQELRSILDYFGKKWRGVTAATAVVKFALWSWSRLAEFTTLRWDSFRQFDDEFHFEIVGKWGVRKWARIPAGLYAELQKIRTESRFVFAAYTEQLRAFHSGTKFAEKVGDEFKPEAFASWLQDRLGDWSESIKAEHATPHVFRKTALQFARDGEDINRSVAADAKLTARVMTGHYVSEAEKALRAASNRTYARILASLLEGGIAERYGYVPESEEARLKEELRQATAAGDWKQVKAIAAKLQSVKPCETPRPSRKSHFTESAEVLS